MLLRALLWMMAAVALLIARLEPAVHRFLLVISFNLTVDRVRESIAPWGPWAAVASTAIMVVQKFLPFPADLLIMDNSAAFGIWDGRAVRLVPASVVDWVDGVAAQGAWMSVLALQFLPLVPFSLLNFLLGITRLTWTTFLWTLAASILPADVLLVALGRGVGEGHGAVPWAFAALALLTFASVGLRSRIVHAWHAPQVHWQRPRRSSV